MVQKIYIKKALTFNDMQLLLGKVGNDPSYGH